MCHPVPGPLPCPEVVAVFYIRPAEVPTLSSVEGDAQVEQQNTVVGFLTILFNQPDFVSQKSELQELIEKRGHLCDFYPKYHCELNFIEQYWGAAKLRFRTAERAATIDDMKKKVLACLDNIPIDQIRRCVQNFFLLSLHAYCV